MSSGYNNSSRGLATPNSARSGSSTKRNPHIPPAAYKLLHKQYDRPKSRMEMFRLQELNEKREQEKAAEKRRWIEQQRQAFGASSIAPNNSTGQQQQQNQHQDLSSVDKSTTANAKKSQHHNTKDPSSVSQVLDVTPIQRLPFRSMHDILAAEDGGDGGDEDSQARRRRDDEVRRLLSSAQGRSTVHRTWKAVEAEAAHEKRSRAIKRTFLTARQTPPPPPMAHPASTNNSKINSSTTANSSGSVSPQPFVFSPSDYYAGEGGIALTPFSSRVERMEQEMERRRGTNVASRESKRKFNAVGELGDEQQQNHLEQRAKARFMAEVLRRREIENSNADGAPDFDDIVERNRKKHEEKQQQQQQQQGESALDKFRLAVRRQKSRVGVHHDDEMFGVLSPVGVVAKALHGEGSDLDDDDDDRLSNSQTHLEGGSGIFNLDDDLDQVRKAKNLWQFQHLQRDRKHGQDSSMNELQEELASQRSKWDDARARLRLAALLGKPAPSDALAELNNNRPADVPEDYEVPGVSQSTAGKGKIGDVGPRANRAGGGGTDMDLQKDDPRNKNNFTITGGGRRTFGPKPAVESTASGSSRVRLSRKRISDIINARGDDDNGPGIEYVDPNVNDDGDGDDDGRVVFPAKPEIDEAELRRRRAAAWRRRAANLEEQNAIASELAAQYWQTRRNFVDAQQREFQQEHEHDYDYDDDGVDENSAVLNVVGSYMTMGTGGLSPSPSIQRALAAAHRSRSNSYNNTHQNHNATADKAAPVVVPMNSLQAIIDSRRNAMAALSQHQNQQPQAQPQLNEQSETTATRTTTTSVVNNSSMNTFSQSSFAFNNNSLANNNSVASASRF